MHTCRKTTGDVWLGGNAKAVTQKNQQIGSAVAAAKVIHTVLASFCSAFEKETDRNILSAKQMLLLSSLWSED